MDFILNNLKPIVLAAITVIVLILIIKYFKKIKIFLFEAKAELGKVAWSTREELMGSTVVVIAITAILAAFIGVVDIALSKALSIVFK